MTHSKMNRKQPKFANSRSGNQLNSSKKHGIGKGNWGDTVNDIDDPDYYSSSSKSTAPKVSVSPTLQNFS